MEFTEEEYKQIAAQLRKPEGEFGEVVANKMNEGNLLMNLNTIEALSVADGETILEIGMGNGFFVKDIVSAAQNVRYIGCDYSIDMIRLSVELNKEFINQGIARFYHSTADELLVDRNSVDTLFTVNTLYFWDNPSIILNEFKRVLKQNGKLVLAFRPAEVMEMYPPTKYNFDFYTIDEASEMLQENGFAIVEVQEFEEPLMDREGKSFPPKHVIIVAK